jgi:hypothetical protein
LGLSLLAAFAVHAAVVYKWVDADGVVHFSDQPSPGAEKIFTSSSTAGTVTTPRSAAGSRQAPRSGAAGAVGAIDYSEFSIVSPVNDQTFFGDDVVAVHLNLKPALKSEQSIRWHLNGKQLDYPPDAVAFSLSHLDRGSYVLAATLTDQQSGESENSNSVTFYVRQSTALAPLHK